MSFIQPFTNYASYVQLSHADRQFMFLPRRQIVFFSLTIFFVNYAVSQKTCIYADMWPNQCWTSGDPPQGSFVDSDEEEFRILAAPLLTTGSASQAPPNPTEDSIDFPELLTKS